MADATHIEWTDATWNVVTGCTVVSPGCTNCYAMKLAGGRLQHHPSRAGLTIESKAGPVWNGEVRFNAEWLTQPLRWTRPRRIFVAAHGDLFHEGVTDDQRDQIFAVMALCPQHVFQILTKRPERMRAYLTTPDWYERFHAALFSDAFRSMFRSASVGVAIDGVNAAYAGRGLPNVWLGVSVEDQARADERIPVLLDTPAAVRWISAEPLLGPVDLLKVGEWADKFEDCGGHPDPHWPSDTQDWTWLNALSGCYEAEARAPSGEHLGPIDVGLLPLAGGLDWVVAGGESGPGGRPMHPDWARQLRDQCAVAGVPFLFKQWGAWAPNLTGYRVEEADGSEAPSIAWPDGQIAWGSADQHGGPGLPLYPVGKKAAGRLLDGVLHDAFPEAR